MKHFIKWTCKMSEALSSIFKSYRSPVFFYDVLPDIWVTLFGGMEEYMEHCKIWNIRNALKQGIYRIFCIWFELDWQKSRGKEYSVVLKYKRNNFRIARKPHYRPYDGFESHLDEWRVLYHGNLMSDNFHKTSVLEKRRIVNLSFTGLYWQLMEVAPVPNLSGRLL